MSNPTERRTRRPSGLPTWPALLLCGVEKSGKTDQCAEASRSAMIDRTFWINFGEDEPSEYDPNVYPFELVDHDGSYRDVLAAIDWCKRQPAADGKVNLIVFDSGSRFWQMLSDAAQQTQNERWRKKHPHEAFPDSPQKPSPDLWNVAGDRWGHFMTALKEHSGPVIITSRLDLVTEFENDQPTKSKTWQHKVQRLGPSDVAGIIHMRAPYPEADNWLMGVRSKRYTYETDKHGKPKNTALPQGWSIEGLWKSFGLEDTVTAPRVTSRPIVEGEAAERDRIAAERGRLLGEIAQAAEGASVSLDAVANRWADLHDGESIHEATDLAGLASVRDTILARTASAQQAPPPAHEPAQEPPMREVSVEDAVAQMRAQQPAQAKKEPAQQPAQAKKEPAQQPAQAKKETGKEKVLRIAEEELTYQASVLNTAVDAYLSPVRTAAGAMSQVKGPKYAMEQRPKVIDALRDQGRLSEADAYARIGQGFPIELAVIFEDVGAEDRAGSQPRESAQR